MIANLISQFPTTYFRESFEEKVKFLSVDPAQLEAKKEQYKNIFYFDSLLKDLEKLLKENPDLNLPSFEENKIIKLISKDKTFLALLSTLDLSNPDSISSVFQNFDQRIKSQNLESGIIRESSEGGRFVTESTVMDTYIEELTALINRITIKNFRIEEIREIKESANGLIKNKEAVENAIKRAEAWIKTEEKALETTLKKRSASFYEKSLEHNSVWTWIWLLCGLISAGYILLTESTFLTNLVTVQNGISTVRNISSGEGILRLFSLIIPSYFTIFFIQRFLIHRKLYQAYKFRDIAVETMNNLTKSYTKDAERSQILEKGLNIIFSEPTIKEEKAPLGIDDVKEILKNKIAQ